MVGTQQGMTHTTKKTLKRGEADLLHSEGMVRQHRWEEPKQGINHPEDPVRAGEVGRFRRAF
jgi:hypothetical protein